MTTIIDFESEQNISILNPRLHQEDKSYLKKIIDSIDSNQSLILVATSGSTKTPKLAAIKKHSFLLAAQSVNQFLSASRNDIWLNPLPLFHVGGLAVAARCWLSGATYLTSSDWSAVHFHDQLEMNKVTHTSLVPTQLFDLTEANLHAPKSLQVALIGGGTLPYSVAKKALDLGWKLVNTFGMTESSAMFAARIVSKELLVDNQFLYVKPLAHIECKITNETHLSIKSDCLFEGYYGFDDNKVSFIDPKNNGWFRTDDFFEVHEHLLKPLGRINNTIKIKGELLNLDSIIHVIATKLPEQFLFHSTVFSVPDERSENKIILAVEQNSHIQDIVSAYNSILPPYAQISDTLICDLLPRNALGKVMTHELRNLYFYDRNKQDKTES